MRREFECEITRKSRAMGRATSGSRSKLLRRAESLSLKKSGKTRAERLAASRSRIKLLIENLSLENLEKESHCIVSQTQNAKMRREFQCEIS